MREHESRDGGAVWRLADAGVEEGAFIAGCSVRGRFSRRSLPTSCATLIWGKILARLPGESVILRTASTSAVATGPDDGSLFAE